MPVLECFKDCGCRPQSICCVIFAQQKCAAKHDTIARKIARELGLAASDHWLNCVVTRQPASCTQAFCDGRRPKGNSAAGTVFIFAVSDLEQIHFWLAASRQQRWQRRYNCELRLIALCWSRFAFLATSRRIFSCLLHVSTCGVLVARNLAS